MIDIKGRKISVSGYRQPIYFDKILVAWGAEKMKLQQSYSNVHYIEDRFSHAKVHNQLIKSKQVVVLGNTMEAVQIAQSARTYLDEIGNYDTQIMLMTTKDSDLRKTLGKGMENWIKNELKDQRISVQPGVNILRMQGDNELEAIFFNKEEDIRDDKVPDTDYFIKPDLVICENGVGRPRKELLSMVGFQDHGSEAKISIGPNTIPHSNTRFSLVHNDIHSPIYAVGNCAEYPSFIQKQRVRTEDMAYNIEAAFYAAMNMLDKRVEFRYIPHTYFKVNDKPVHFVGERGHKYTETIIDGDTKSGRFIIWYVLGEEVVGFCTVGY